MMEVRIVYNVGRHVIGPQFLGFVVPFAFGIKYVRPPVNHSAISSGFSIMFV